jgi:hypothetical protein
VNPNPNDDYLERIKAEIRAEADLARARDPLPRCEPPSRAALQASINDGIERDRLDYGIGELTGAHHRAFVDQAFRALLKRPPDESWSEVQVHLLAGGASKAEVLGNLRYSSAGRRIGTRVRGLLPRYALAKLARVPVLGYCVDWGLALAGLPILLRHQRAADALVDARFTATANTQRDHTSRVDNLKSHLDALSAEHDRRSEVVREDIQRALLCLDDLERRAAVLERRVAELEKHADAEAHEIVELRHYVHTANHWVSSLQRSLGELEDVANLDREHAQALAAAIGETSEEAAARRMRHTTWSAALAAYLPTGARVLDLGSGDGAWLDALAVHGIATNGIETNHALVSRAQARGTHVALGDSFDALARCADASLDALVLAVYTFGASPVGITTFLTEARRTLKAGGCLLLRFEQEPGRLFDAPTGTPDPQHWALILGAAGFSAPSVLPASGGAAVLARQP